MKFYGIYKITNLVNGKMYIGQHTTSDLDDGYMGSGKVIKLALKKYGAENFRKEWLGFYQDQEELNYMELVFVDQTWIDRSDTYNIALGGSVCNARGYKWTAEQRRRLSESVSGSRNHNYGLRHTEDQKKHLSRVMKGKKNAKGCRHSEEFRHKLSLRMKGKKLALGRKHSDAAKAMIKAGNIGMKFWNNGTVSVRARECPEGFRPGRLPKRSKIA